MKGTRDQGAGGGGRETREGTWIESQCIPGMYGNVTVKPVISYSPVGQEENQCGFKDSK